MVIYFDKIFINNFKNAYLSVIIFKNNAKY